MSKTISVHNMFSPGLTLELSCIELVHNSMNNLSSYCGLVDAEIRASDDYLPVPIKSGFDGFFYLFKVQTKYRHTLQLT